MITIVEGTNGIYSEKDAAKFIREHVVIKKSDLKKIRALAKKCGFLKELKALDVQVHSMNRMF